MAAEDCSGGGRASKKEHDGRRVECDVCGKTVQITPYAAMHKHRADSQERQANWRLAAGDDQISDDDKYMIGEYMTGQCAAWAVAHQREYPHLQFGIDWQRVTPDDPDWDFEDGDEGEVWQPQHIFTHDDTYAYDVRGPRPLDAIQRWDNVTLNHSLKDVRSTGMHESGWEPEPDFVRRVPPHAGPANPQERQANWRMAAVNQEMVDGLNTQFHDWWGQQGNSGGSVDDMAQMDFMSEDRGPIGHWPNIENFLKERYPAAHKGLGMGLEAEWSLDGAAKPYPTGPEAIKQHGYDPAEISAAMLLLHNQSDPFRGDMAQQDQDRLNDIAQKRFTMQRNYDNRTAPKPLVTAAVNQKYVDDLDNEFTEWWNGGGEQKFHESHHPGEPPDPSDNSAWDEHRWKKQDYANARGTINRRGPVGYWPNVESFFSDKYPAAHLGLEMGQERAGYALSRDQDNEYGRAYPTGPDAVAQYGYDPKELAAGMLLLHNKSHPMRGDLGEKDLNRLNDIVQKRTQMQRNYEQRQPITATFKTAADLVKEYTDGLNTEFHDWAEENLPVSFSEGWDYTKPMGGPLTYWDNIEEFFHDKYPEAHRGFNMAEEKARPLMDTGYNSWGGGRPYETGPEAVEKYGYDPRQLAAGFMYLHTWSHAQSPQNQWRGDKLPRDIDRLADIFQKRQQMQNNYEQKQQAPQPITASISFNRELTDRLRNEFVEWAKPMIEKTDWPYGGRWAPKPEKLIQEWPYIEKFIGERYPAAHKGFDMGLEEAGPSLDAGEYQTGPDVENSLGYDPKEIASAFLLMHNDASTGTFMDRGEDVADMDQQRLIDIYTKRVKMQREYEQKQQVPQPITAALDLLRQSNHFAGSRIT